ncbi:hypothetical protein QR680_004317 [Steinernema hermaphroditum]|uniref:Uncharacterized protein n=1 Tax=Steinernema hermaphroditum TaxID=289476 RepID=A0AA39HQL4_9BILA|nr:hypothetical protein QR680_004317 [Steinernema hermaphroditum]
MSSTVQSVLLVFNRITMAISGIQICLSILLYTILTLSDARSISADLIDPKLFAFSLSMISLTELVGALVMSRKDQNDGGCQKWSTTISYFVANLLLVWAFLHLVVLHTRIDFLVLYTGNIRVLEWNLTLLEASFLVSILTASITFIAYVLPAEHPKNYKLLDAA